MNKSEQCLDLSRQCIDSQSRRQPHSRGSAQQ
jgi:hypothetical protein